MSENKKCLVFTFKISVVCMLLCLLIFVLCFFIYFKKPMQRESVFGMASVGYTVVIDAGHGGRDGGAVSEDGLLEKNLNLNVSSRISDILNICGIKTVMTRTNDSLVCDENNPDLKGKIKMTDLSNRLKIARNSGAAMFVSIHMNKFSVEKYKGLQVYYSKNNDNSEVIASLIQDNVRAILQPKNNREIKAAGNNIYLLDRLEIPAVLIECGFLSNKEESGKLADLVYQTQLSMVISDCIMTNLFTNANN